MTDNKRSESLQESEEKTPNLKLLKLVEELQVHQIELEMQNQQLRSVQSELEHQRFKYLRFYNYFPLPIMNLDKSGIIVSMNMKAEQLIDPSAIINPAGLAMSRLIEKNFHKAFFDCLEGIVNTRAPVTCSLELTNCRHAKAEINMSYIDDVDGSDTGSEIIICIVPGKS